MGTWVSAVELKRGMTHLGLMPPQALVTTMWVAPMCRSTRIGIVARHSGCLASATGLGQRCCTPIAVRCGALSTELKCEESINLPFIHVDPALHRDDTLPSQVSKHQLALVPGHLPDQAQIMRHHRGNSIPPTVRLGSGRMRRAVRRGGGRRERGVAEANAPCWLQTLGSPHTESP